MKQTVQLWIDRIERGVTYFTALCMGVLSVLVSWQVFARYVLRASPYWVEEIVVTGMMWVGLLGAAACVWTGSHMSLELVVKRLPERFKVLVEIIVDLGIGAFAMFLLTQGWVLAETTMSSQMSTVPVPLGYTYIVIPIAGGFMILFAFLRAFLKIADAIAKKGEPHA
ncbi:MAG: TRAP transporter small permease [Spirochaetes bacterium]|nr:TRAP transporter small permease [Spirochaetota bacterium]